MFAQLRDGLIERLDRAVRAREHDASFHGDEDVGRERIEIRLWGKRIGHCPEAFANGIDPALKILGDERMRGRVFGIDFERQAAEGAAVPGVGGQDALTVSGEDREDAFEWFRGGCESGIDYHGPQEL